MKRARSPFLASPLVFAMAGWACLSGPACGARTGLEGDGARDACDPASPGVIVVDPAFYTREKVPGDATANKFAVKAFEDVYRDVAPDLANLLHASTGRTYQVVRGASPCANGAGIFLVLGGSPMASAAPAPFATRLAELKKAMEPGPTQNARARGAYAHYRDGNALWVGGATTSGAIAGAYALLRGAGFDFLASLDHWVSYPASPPQLLGAGLPLGQVVSREPSAPFVGVTPRVHLTGDPQQGSTTVEDPDTVYARFRARALLPNAFDAVTEDMTAQFLDDPARCEALNDTSLPRLPFWGGQPAAGVVAQHLPKPIWKPGIGCVVPAPLDWPAQHSEFLPDPPPGTSDASAQAAVGWSSDATGAYLRLYDADGHDAYELNPTSTALARCGTEDQPVACAGGEAPTLPDPDDFSLGGTVGQYQAFLLQTLERRRGSAAPDWAGPLTVTSGFNAGNDFSPKTTSYSKICALYGLTCPDGGVPRRNEAWMHLANVMAADAASKTSPAPWMAYAPHIDLRSPPNVPIGPGVLVQAKIWQQRGNLTIPEIFGGWREYRRSAKIPYPAWTHDTILDGCAGARPYDHENLACRRAIDMWAGFEGIATEGNGFLIVNAPVLYAHARMAWVRADDPTFSQAWDAELAKKQTWDEGTAFRANASARFQGYVDEFFDRSFPASVRAHMKDVLGNAWAGQQGASVVTVRPVVKRMLDAVAALGNVSQAERDRVGDVALYVHYQAQRALVGALPATQTAAKQAALSTFVWVNRARLLPHADACGVEAKQGSKDAEPLSTAEALALLAADYDELKALGPGVDTLVKFGPPYVPLEWDNLPPATTDMQAVSILEHANDAGLAVFHARTDAPTHFKITHYEDAAHPAVPDPNRGSRVRVRKEFDVSTVSLCAPGGDVVFEATTGQPEPADPELQAYGPSFTTKTTLEFDWPPAGLPGGTYVLDLERRDTGYLFLIESSAHTPLSVANAMQTFGPGYFTSLGGGFPPQWEPYFWVPKGTVALGLLNGLSAGIVPADVPLPDCVAQPSALCFSTQDGAFIPVESGKDGAPWVLSNPGTFAPIGFTNVPNLFSRDGAHLMVPKAVHPNPPP